MRPDVACPRPLQAFPSSCRGRAPCCVWPPGQAPHGRLLHSGLAVRTPLNVDGAASASRSAGLYGKNEAMQLEESVAISAGRTGKRRATGSFPACVFTVNTKLRFLTKGRGPPGQIKAHFRQMISSGLLGSMQAV